MSLVFLHRNFAPGGLEACRVEDFPLSVASEMTQEWLHGRFVLPTFFVGDGQAISLPHDFISMGAASFWLGG